MKFTKEQLKTIQLAEIFIDNVKVKLEMEEKFKNDLSKVFILKIVRGFILISIILIFGMPYRFLGYVFFACWIICIFKISKVIEKTEIQTIKNKNFERTVAYVLRMREKYK